MQLSRLLRFALGAGLAGASKLHTLSTPKDAAIKKVVIMLEELREKVAQEGVKEAATYDKFACFCKDTIKEKGEAVANGENSQSTIQSVIDKLEADRSDFDSDIAALRTEIDDGHSSIEKLTKDRKKHLREYERNNADLEAAVSGCEQAILVVKASKQEPDFVQVRAVAETVSQTTDLAEALGLGGNLSAESLLLLQRAAAKPEVPLSEYKFHSGEIISMLETVCGSFKTKKQDVVKAEVDSVQDFNLGVQDTESTFKADERAVEAKTKKKAEKVEAIADNSRDLTTISATLLEDKKYLTEISSACQRKAATWDERQQVRTEELVAITKAIDLVQGTIKEKTAKGKIRLEQRGARFRKAQVIAKSSISMEDIEAEAEAADAAGAVGGNLGFLQRHSDRQRRWKVSAAAPGSDDTDGRQAVIDLLRSRGAQLKSTALVGLASELAVEPFAKVTALLQELIERLKTQASHETTQKAWCDKGISEAEQKREASADKIRDLNGGMASREARQDKLVEEMAELVDDIEKLKKKQKDADAEREEEEEEHEETVQEALAGEGAVKTALHLLRNFYKAAAKGKAEGKAEGKVEGKDEGKVEGKAKGKTEGKAEDEGEIVPKGLRTDDMPDAGFKAGEDYRGGQGGADGVLGMLEVIQSDFERARRETRKAERQAEKDHTKFTTATRSAIAQKSEAKGQMATQKSGLEERRTDDESNLASETKLLEGAIAELVQLKEACTDTAMSYEERVARREEEIAALNKAHCILNAYAADASSWEC